MEQKAIGPTFPDELRATKVPLDGIAWGADGAISYREDVPQAVKDQVAALYAAHNPASPSTAQIDAERDRRLAAGFADTAAAGEIGRAACRGRVENSGGRRSLKKKK